MGINGAYKPWNITGGAQRIHFGFNYHRIANIWRVVEPPNQSSTNKGFGHTALFSDPFKIGILPNKNHPASLGGTPIDGNHIYTLLLWNNPINGLVSERIQSRKHSSFDHEIWREVPNIGLIFSCVLVSFSQLLLSYIDEPFRYGADIWGILRVNVTIYIAYVRIHYGYGGAKWLAMPPKTISTTATQFLGAERQLKGPSHSCGRIDREMWMNLKS